MHGQKNRTPQCFDTVGYVIGPVKNQYDRLCVPRSEYHGTQNHANHAISHTNTVHTIPEAWVKKFRPRNFLGRLFMDRLELFSFLGTDVCLQCWLVMLQLYCLPGLHIDRSALCIQYYWCCPEHHTKLTNTSSRALTDSQQMCLDRMELLQHITLVKSEAFYFLDLSLNCMLTIRR